MGKACLWLVYLVNELSLSLSSHYNVFVSIHVITMFNLNTHIYIILYFYMYTCITRINLYKLDIKLYKCINKFIKYEINIYNLVIINVGVFL